MLEGFNQVPKIAPLSQNVAAPASPMVHITHAARNEIHYAAPPSVNMVPFSNDDVYRPIPPPS